MFKRLIRFRNEVVTLWHAMWNPLTPTYLKVAAVLTALYVLSPADLLPDFIPVIGIVDDVLLVTFMVSWIVSRLPQPAWQTRYNPSQEGTHDGRTINGTSRRR